jgi:hypothetical protein
MKFVLDSKETSGHPDAYRAGSLLGDLHTDRIKADYRLDDTRVGTSARGIAGPSIRATGSGV